MHLLMFLFPCTNFPYNSLFLYVISPENPKLCTCFARLLVLLFLLFCSQMNSRKINYQEQIHQQSHGLVSDFDLDFTDCSNQFVVNTQHPPDQMGLGRFKSPTSALYASEQFMGFDSCFGSRTCDSQLFPSYQSSSGGAFAIGSAPNFDARNTLQSIVKSHDLNTSQYFSKLPRIYDPQNKSLGNNNDVSVARYLLSSYIEERDHRVSTYSSPFAQLGQEKQSPRLSCGDDFNVAGSASTGAVASSKTRIRWTQELHEKFVECVNHLGGAEKATPKAVLKLMDSDGLTIFHVKSHLQKYRIAKYVPDKSEGRTDKRSTTNNLPQLDSKTGLQIKEALQLQLDVQRQLHEQLEIQRNLQLRIEEQGKQLRMMFDKQQQTNTSPEDAKVSVPEQASDDKTTFTSNLS